MITYLQKYNYDIQYLPEKQMLLADTYLRALLPECFGGIELENINAMLDAIKTQKLWESMKTTTIEDLGFQDLKKVILDDWVTDKILGPRN